MTRSARTRSVIVRRADAADIATSRLLAEPGLSVSLGDAGIATLRLQRSTPAAIVERSDLTISTRFGRMSWHGYEAWLLALSGVDAALAEHRAAREAFVHYALAALPATLGAALGEPRCDAHADGSYGSRDPCDPCNPYATNDDKLLVSLGCTLHGLCVSMHLRLDAQTLNRMLDQGPWQSPSAAIAPRLAQLPSCARVMAGAISLPYTEVRSLANGDIIRPPAPMFDAAGVGCIVVAGVALQVRWRDADSSFEIHNVMQHDTPASPHPPTVALPSDTPAPIDPARLPVQLSFVIGTLALTLGELAAARSGTLLRLAEGMPPTVRIEANGVPVGYGELVDLDGRLAVEITQWHGTSGAAL